MLYSHLFLTILFTTLMVTLGSYVIPKNKYDIIGNDGILLDTAWIFIASKIGPAFNKSF